MEQIKSNSLLGKRTRAPKSDENNTKNTGKSVKARKKSPLYMKGTPEAVAKWQAKMEERA